MTPPPPPSPTPSPSPSASPSPAPFVEPDHIAVQHILVSFRGAGTKATRSQPEAQALAGKVLQLAQEGGDYDKLVTEYTDDSPPGIYKMANKGVKEGPGEYNRMGMVPAFGNVGFKLKPGEIGMAPFDRRDSPYGWHIIKRVE